MPSEDRTKALIIEYDDGRVRRLVVPETAKVTLGPVYPRSQQGGRYGDDAAGGALYLRVYKTATNMLLVEPGVRAFHVESLDFSELGTDDGKPAWNAIDEVTYLAKQVRRKMMPDEPGPRRGR